MDAIAQAMSAQGGDLEEIAKLLYGDGAWEFISKRKPMTEEQRNRTQARIGLATNVVGIAAGTAGLVAASKNPALRRAGANFENAGPVTRRVGGMSFRGKKLTAKGRGRLYQVGAGGAVALQGANLAGDAIANRVLSRSAKEKVKKSRGPETILGAVHTTGLTYLAGSQVKKKKREGKYVPINPEGEIKKNVEIDTTFEISKVDSDKRQVFGWASVITMDGQPVVDLQDDYMAMETIEKAAYDYVKSSRKGGNMHDRDGDAPRHVSDMIESFVVTEEKKKTLGLPDTFPTGWLVGFQVNDDETWAQVKDGKRKQFSIHGSGQRVEKVLDS